MASKNPYSRSCHRGFIRYTVNLDLATLAVVRCNCTICQKTGYMSVRLDSADFSLISPASESELSDYQYGSKRMHHIFCPTCGVRCAIRGTYQFKGKEVEVRTINLRTLDQAEGVDWTAVKIEYADGLRDNWELRSSDKPFPGGAW